jgi:hypothetical protein
VDLANHHAPIQHTQEVKRRGKMARTPGATHTNLQTAGLTLGTGSQQPGLLMRIATRIPWFWQEVDQGSLPTLFAATSEDAAGGAYYGPSGFGELTGMPANAKIPKAALDEATAARLWTVSEELTGVRFPADAAP